MRFDFLSFVCGGHEAICEGGGRGVREREKEGKREGKEGRKEGREEERERHTSSS